MFRFIMTDENTEQSLRKILFILIPIALLTVKPEVSSPNDASRMATIQSLVEKHTLVIDESVFANTRDKVFVNHHFYSDKPVIPAVLGAIVYLPIYHLGIKLNYGWNPAYYLITLFTVKLFWLAGLIAFYFALSFGKLNNSSRFHLMMALGIASLYFTWSSTFNNHLLAASSLMIGFWFLLKASNHDAVKKNLFLAALFLSLSGSSDIPTSVFYPGFFFYALAKTHLRKNILFYLLPLLITALPTMLVNYYISGSLVPVQLHRVYFEYPGSEWLGSNALSGMNANRGWFLLKYSLNALFGSKGFLIYNPFLFIAIYYLIAEIKNRRLFWREALVIAIASLILVLYYLVMTNNYGGWSYSIRWFVPLLPLLFFFIHPYFETITHRKRLIFRYLFYLSFIIALIGLINPWSITTRISSFPILANIKQLISFVGRGW